jgi:amino acid permease
MYLSIGIAGYLSTLDATPALFINRELPSNIYVGPHDIFMTVGKIAMALNLFFVIPVNMNPCRMQLITLLKLEDFKRKNVLHYFLTAVILLAAAAAAMVIPNISVVFDVLGGFFATMLSYTFPAMIYLKCTNMRQGHYKRWLVYLIAAATTIAGFASGFLGLLKAFHIINPN